MKKPVQTLAEMEAIRSRGISPVLYHGNVTGWQKSSSGKRIDPDPGTVAWTSLGTKTADGREKDGYPEQKKQGARAEDWGRRKDQGNQRDAEAD